MQSALKDLRYARTQRELLQIKAPLSGTVTAIHYKPGEAINPNTILAELFDLDRLNIAVRIPSAEAAELAMGQRVEIGVSFQQSKVTFIGAQIDPLTDTLLVRVSLNSDSGLRPGQFVHIRVQVEERPERLAVPIASVVKQEGASVIALVEGDNASIKAIKAIKTGLRDGSLVEIEGENLREGMTIVTQGAYGLPYDTRIKVIK